MQRAFISRLHHVIRKVNGVINIERAERLKKAGLMTEHGQKLIYIAKQTGRWKSNVTE